MSLVTDISVRELPIFALPDVVLFPQEILPLHIFESRYRIMLKNVLETDSRFGVVRLDPETKELSNVGCCAEILQCQTFDDGRSNIVTMGQQRFRILKLLRETPYRSAMVSWIEDEKVMDQDLLENLSESVKCALQDVVSLTGKLFDAETLLPDDLPDLPRELSFWIASHLGGSVSLEQQVLLELIDTTQRLQREYEILDHTRKDLAARTTLKDTFMNSDKAKG